MNSKTGGSHGAITIEGYSFSDVVLTTRDVFEDYGYRLSKAEPDHMSFDRPGTRADQIKYGSFGSSGVVIRVKVDIQEMGIETYFLRCDVYSVRDAGDPVLEDESKIIMVSSKPYQEMLEEVQARLKAKIAPH